MLRGTSGNTHVFCCQPAVSLDEKNQGGVKRATDLEERCPFGIDYYNSTTLIQNWAKNSPPEQITDVCIVQTSTNHTENGPLIQLCEETHHLLLSKRHKTHIVETYSHSEYFSFFHPKFPEVNSRKICTL